MKSRRIFWDDKRFSVKVYPLARKLKSAVDPTSARVCGKHVGRLGLFSVLSNVDSSCQRWKIFGIRPFFTATGGKERGREGGREGEIRGRREEKKERGWRKRRRRKRLHVWNLVTLHLKIKMKIQIDPEFKRFLQGNWKMGEWKKQEEGNGEEGRHHHHPCKHSH